MSASKDSFLIWNSEFSFCTFADMKLNMRIMHEYNYRCLNAYLQFLTLFIGYWLIHGQASQDSQCFLLVGLMNHNMSREIYCREKGRREGVRISHKIDHPTLLLCKSRHFHSDHSSLVILRNWWIQLGAFFGRQVNIFCFEEPCVSHGALAGGSLIPPF